jgi:signal transduction histidine kinase
MEMGLKSPSRGMISALNPLLRNSWLARIISRHLSVVLLLLVLLGEACVVLFVMRDLGRSYATVERMYNGSVQGLLHIGDMQYEAQETRRSTLYALTTNDGNLQVTYADQSRDADRGVTQGIAQYLAEAHTAPETRAGQQLAKDWNDYLKVRDQVLGLILENSPKEAVQLDLNLGVLEFDHVRRDLDELKQRYDEQASQQLATVAELSRASMTRLTAALVFGLFLGTIAIWAIQRSRVRSAMQLAKLQMDFVASVSHELRTPLTAILTAGENIRDGLAFDPEHLFEQGSVITNQASQLMEIVDQVLQFSVTREAKLAHSLRELHASDVINDALRSTRSQLEYAGFSLETKIDSNLPPFIADLSLLSQCMQNLIVNAIKYSKGSRWIGISARMNREENAILISVEDRGIGIQSEELSRIFEPFYRSPQVVGAKIRGTGLGLSIAKRTVEIFGGELTVSTEMGVGSVFTMHLPVATDVAAESVERRRAVGRARV